MDTGNPTIPDTIEIRYEHHKSGVMCAVSDDLPGLMVFGRSLEKLQDDVLAVASELVRKKFGADVSYHWNAPLSDDFQPIEPGRLHREPLHA